jgi:hypothetical protein
MAKKDRSKGTKILTLPATWLTLPERSLAFQALFNKEEKATLLEFRQENQKLFAKAKVIVVDLRKTEGFLGDTICDSYLTDALTQRYPQKLILEWSRCPELLGRHSILTDWGQEKNKIVLHFRKGPNDKTKKEAFKLEEIVKIVSRYNSAVPAGFFNQEAEKKLSFHEIPLHQLHRAQILWEVLYDIRQFKRPPYPSIGLAKKDQKAAVKVFAKLGKTDSFNFIIHPDAHSLHFKEKSWPVLKWVSLMKALAGFGRVFLTQGADHPQLTSEIAKECAAQAIPLTPLPSLSLAQYTALLQCFPKKKTVLVGLESMAGTHLAPGLGLKSVVVAAGQLFNPAVYGPFGGTVVHNEENTAASVSVEKVVEAIRKSLRA